MGKVVIYGPEVPNYIALVSPSRIEVADTPEVNFRVLEVFATGLSVGFEDTDLKTYLIEEFSKGESFGTGDTTMETYLIEEVTFTNA